jgi:catechol 2,3-dioxygenase-like lactoylglutathione lyase family enzyme
VLPHDGSSPLHLAFASAAADLDSWRTWLADRGVAIEREIAGHGGSVSVCFRDPDGNVVELATPSIWGMAW